MAIPKYNLKDFLKENKGYTLYKRLKDTTLIKLPNGDLLKILDPELLIRLLATGYDLEKRLSVAHEFESFKSFTMPTAMLDDYGIVNSYIMPYFPGVDFTNYYEDIYNLTSYAKLHSQFENNIKDGNELGLVFPDLCTTENIRITPDKKVIFLDYDGIQIKNMPAIGYSDFLGEPKKVLTKKYYDFETGLFTKEVDIMSAIFLYFVDVFGVNLAVVDTVNPEDGELITLDYIFNVIKLYDQDIQHKVWKLFQENEKNEFLGDDLYRLADKYKLVTPTFNHDLKVLERK